MRRILIDNARKRNSLKQGGDNARHDIRDDGAVRNPDVGPAHRIHPGRRSANPPNRSPSTGSNS
ncbi:MAG TPA: ECF-type sigma factor [Planctomycetaceae bacterium]|nr:ECF-type sigma factor [Planctomycetaceae bacterium]HQZ65184.1 ECF-type sigma factor [Planctomycetaceae bacterium]